MPCRRKPGRLRFSRSNDEEEGRELRGPRGESQHARGYPQLPGGRRIERESERRALADRALARDRAAVLLDHRGCAHSIVYDVWKSVLGQPSNLPELPRLVRRGRKKIWPQPDGEDEGRS